MSSQKYTLSCGNNKNNQIFIRYCDPEVSSRRAIVFVHGSIISSIMYDVPISGKTWLNFTASHNIHSFTFDIRGYGFSSKLQAMNAVPEESMPLMRAEEAAKDLQEIVAHVKEKIGIDKVDLCAFSWGTIAACQFAVQYPKDVRTLTLIGPMHACENPLWSRLPDPDNPNDLRGTIKGYQVGSKESLIGMLTKKISVDNQEHVLIGEEVVHLIVKETLRSDESWSQENSSDCFRVPNGYMRDLLDVYNLKPLYKAQDITCPVMIMKGVQDKASQDQDINFLHAFLGSTEKKYVVFEKASHFGVIEKEGQRMREKMLSFIQEY